MNPPNRRQLKTVADFWRPISQPEPDSVLPTPLLPGLITPGVWFLVGKDKLGKTVMAQALALTLATGRSFLGLPMLGSPQKVLYIDEQVGAAVMDMRFKALLNGQGEAVDLEALRAYDANLSRLSLSGFRFANPEQRTLLKKVIKETKPTWIFFDPLIALATWKQLEHTEEGAELSEYLEGLYHHQDCSLLLLNHAVKSPRRGQTRPSEWALGSFQLRLTASGWLGLTADKKDKRWITVQSNLLGLDHAFGVEWQQKGPDEAPTLIQLTVVPEGGVATADDPDLKALVPWALHEDGVSLQQIAGSLGYSEVFPALRERVKRAGWVVTRTGAHGKQFFAPRVMTE